MLKERKCPMMTKRMLKISVCFVLAVAALGAAKLVWNSLRNKQADNRAVKSEDKKDSQSAPKTVADRLKYERPNLRQLPQPQEWSKTQPNQLSFNSFNEQKPHKNAKS